MKTNFTQTLIALSIALGTPVIFAENQQANNKAQHETASSHRLDIYTAISTALYEDDLAAAQSAASSMVQETQNAELKTAAQAIAASKNIDDARLHFNELSELAIPIAKEEKLMHVAHCPMAMKGKGASWLQDSEEEIQNPYFGAKMAHCGKIIK